MGGTGAAVVGAQLPVVFSHYFGVFILNAFSLVIVFIRRSLPLLSLSLSPSVSAALSAFALCICSAIW